MPKQPQKRESGMEKRKDPPAPQSAETGGGEAVDPEAEERRRKKRAYYQKNRERIRAQQREYYCRIGKKAHAERIRRYRQEKRDSICARRRDDRRQNPEKYREWDRRYREAHREQIRERNRKYWAAHRKELSGRRRGGPRRFPVDSGKYYRAHREALLEAQRRRYHENPEPQRERMRRYYQKNRYALCRKRLERDCYHSMDSIRERYPEQVRRYLERYPFEQYAHRPILRELARRSISPSSAVYMECYDAGMLAYLYSIHRCARMGYEHTPFYIVHMIRVLTGCALIAAGETGNLCHENGLFEYRIDSSDRAGKI